MSRSSAQERVTGVRELQEDSAINPAQAYPVLSTVNVQLPTKLGRDFYQQVDPLTKIEIVIFYKKTCQEYKTC